MGHPGRIRILELLVDRDRTIGELVRETGMETSHVSHQVTVLRRAGLVTSERVRSTVTCALGDPQIAQVLVVARSLLANHLRNTQALLSALDGIDDDAVSLDLDSQDDDAVS